MSDSSNSPSTSVAGFPGFCAPGSSDAFGLPARSMSEPMLAALESGAAVYYQGKVRERFTFGDEILMVTSDRISAFDRILDVIPGKGEILNRLSLFWFDATGDIVPNHIIAPVGSRSVRVRSAEVLPVEVVVRGYLTGSAWRDYQAGKAVSGIELPAGMRKDERFPEAIITPSTKAEIGDHDEPVSEAEIVSRGIVDAELWAKIRKAALELFQRGTDIAARQGLILVDTKYEFGLVDGELILVDEVHTPDSSRYWYAESYDADFAAGNEQKKLDKEFLRRWLMEQGFMGDGSAPVIPAAVKEELLQKYRESYRLLTGTEFEPMFSNSESDYREIESCF